MQYCFHIKSYKLHKEQLNEYEYQVNTEHQEEKKTKNKKLKKSTNKNSIGIHTRNFMKRFGLLYLLPETVYRLFPGGLDNGCTYMVNGKRTTKKQRNKFTTLPYHIMYDPMPKRGLRAKTDEEKQTEKKNRFFLFCICFHEFLVLNAKCVRIAYADTFAVIFMEYGSRLSYIVQYVSHSHVFCLANQIIYYLIYGKCGSFPLILCLYYYSFISFILKLICLSLCWVCAPYNTNARSFL